MACEIALEVYRDFVTHSNNYNKILCVSILEPLCGMLKASILYYQKFVGDMSEIKHKLNPYDPLHSK